MVFEAYLYVMRVLLSYLCDDSRVAVWPVLSATAVCCSVAEFLNVYLSGVVPCAKAFDLFILW